MVGVPGLAKTLLVSSLARALGLTFGRIQFTPDLLPADITGTDVLNEVDAGGGRIKREVEFMRGPIFENLVLADEINRTPPKTQAALLQAMQERQVTQGGTTHPLPNPFQVFATRNPIEQEGRIRYLKLSSIDFCWKSTSNTRRRSKRSKLPVEQHLAEFRKFAASFRNRMFSHLGD